MLRTYEPGLGTNRSTDPVWCPSVPSVGRPTATASPRSLEATRRVPHPGRRQTVGQGAVGPADDRETLSTQKSQPCPGRLHRVRRPFRGGEGHLLCTRLCLQPYIRNWSATITSIAWQF